MSGKKFAELEKEIGEIGELRSKAEATDEDLTSLLAGPKGL
ncbi:MAG TPA: hypothetical protein VLK65_26740 [Vicinamibacteria bacterium]|nr:hypothetical protein [Vicinamibacteria bacterium]